MIYVCPPFIWEARHEGDKNAGREYSYLFADESDELHLFADAIGLDREWCRTRTPWFHHYRISMPQYRDAIENGAVETELKGYLQNAKSAHYRAIMCGSKFGYSKADADAKVKYIEKQQGRHSRPTHMKSYECPHCGLWHIAKDKDR